MNNLFSGMTALETEGKSRPTTFDLRYKVSTSRFRFSAGAQEALNTEQNGIVVAINDDASVCMIGILPKEQAKLLNAKTPEFSHPKLRAKLDAFIGRVEEGKDHQNFRLTEVGDHQGVLYFQIEAWANQSGLIDIQGTIPGSDTPTALPSVAPKAAAEVSAETVQEEAPEEVAEVAVAATTEDPDDLFDDLD